MNQRKFKYIIATSAYNPNSGGIIVLHKLCDLLNTSGQEAWLCPMDFCEYFVTGKTILKTLLKRLNHPILTYRHFRLLLHNTKRFSTNPDWKTPIINPWKLFFSNGLPEYIVVYPEILSGNMLGAKHVVRYFMHNPGHFTGKVNYGYGELYFRYSNSFARDYIPLQGSTISKHLITISTTPPCYNMNNIATERKGTAYIVRKGKGKTLVHDLRDSILLDNLSHEETAAILKQVKLCVCYDPITAYSVFSLLCGCPCTIILGNNETPSTYHPSIEEQKVFNYGMNDNHVNISEAIKWAQNRVLTQQKRNNEAIAAFIQESQNYFKI